MPAPWLIPAILSGVSTGASALAGNSQGKRDERQMARDALESDRDYDFRLRGYNDSLGSMAYTNPLKAAMLQRMSGKAGLDTAAMGLPDITKYRAPVGYDPRTAEQRARIVAETQGRQYKGGFRDDALRMFDEQTRGRRGMSDPNFRTADIFDSVRRNAGTPQINMRDQMRKRLGG